MSRAGSQRRDVAVGVLLVTVALMLADTRWAWAAGNETLGASAAGAIFFWSFAVSAVVGAIFVVTRHNLIAAVMGMVGTFLAIAAVYAMLYAHFVAVMQVLVYAGAIMVLFVFVVMMVAEPVVIPWARNTIGLQVIGGASVLYLVSRLVMVLSQVQAPDTARGSLAPGDVIGGTDFGSTEAIGRVLFQDFLFPFEAVSLVLLVAVVGAVALARPHHKVSPEQGEGGE